MTDSAAALALLRQMIKAKDLQSVADEIGYTKSAVCHVAQETYKGDPGRVLRAVEETYSQQAVECPVKGAIPLAECVKNKRLPFSGVNPVRVMLAKTCPRCPQGAGAKEVI